MSKKHIKQIYELKLIHDTVTCSVKLNTLNKNKRKSDKKNLNFFSVYF